MSNIKKNVLRRLFPLLLLAGFSAFLFYSNVTRADEANTSGNSSATKFTPEIIKAKIKEVDATTGLSAETKAELMELYRKTLSNLEINRSNKSQARAYIQARRKAPQQAREIRKKLKKAEKDSPEAVVDVKSKTPTIEIEQMYLGEKANFSAVEAKLDSFKEKLKLEVTRPDEARQRLMEVKQRQQELTTKLNLPLAKDQIPVLIEARNWLLKSERLALTTEANALDKELLSQSMRIELLQANRDKTARTLKRIDVRIRLLENLLSLRRRTEAEEAIVLTGVAEQEAKGKHPIIQKIARENTELSEELSVLANTRQGITNSVDVANKKSDEINADFESARQKIEIAGLGEVLGLVLQEQKRNLPDLGDYRKKVLKREKSSIKSGLRLIQNKEELRFLKDKDAYIERYIKGFSKEELNSVNTDLRVLLQNREPILVKLIAADNAYLRDVTELDVAQKKVLNSAEIYNKYLSQRLLWLRSTPPINLNSLQTLPGEISLLFAPAQWYKVIAAIAYQITNSISFSLLLLVTGILLWYRKTLRHELIDSAKYLGKISTDRIRYTYKTIGYTLLLALPWPLLMFTIGWQLKIYVDATELTRAAGIALVNVSILFYALRLLQLSCIPDGLTTAHFHWSDTSLKLFRRELNKLIIVLLPAYIVTLTAGEMIAITLGGTVVKIAGVIVIGALGLFFYRALHPSKGSLFYNFNKNPTHLAYRLRYLWFLAVIAINLVLVGLILTGYVYTAGTLIEFLFRTVVFLLVLLLIDQMIKRWLLLTRRKLALQAALDRRAAAQTVENTKETTLKTEDGMSIEVDEPRVDLVALSAESIKVVNTALVIAGFAGLWIIWSDILPAFSIFDITVWHQSIVVNGVEQLEPVTLKNLGYAFLIVFITVVYSKRLPALLEIFLLKRLDMTSGSRYTVKTLTSYSVVALGIILVWNSIGGRWEQIQWLAAALSLGIGFGLQEIVANFISGIIILFERPIRVGDVVTVGDTDGVVTRINIRATTIRNWDRKELLVPNKEFITGRLLNWTLSDQTTRVIISVGVAYGSDVDKAMELMIEAAKEQEHVMDDPEPYVTFEEFADSALLLRIRAYLPTIEYRIKTISGLHQSINRKFNDANINIAFPQMDIHLRSSEPIIQKPVET